MVEPTTATLTPEEVDPVASIAASKLFDKESSIINADGLALLIDVAAKIKALPVGTEICIKGYADGVGQTLFNLALSVDRAVSVQIELRGQGVINPLETVGFGEEGAVDGVDDPTRRRVDIIEAPVVEGLSLEMRCAKLDDLGD